jgi:hypothetical protein
MTMALPSALIVDDEPLVANALRRRLLTSFDVA